MRVRLLDKSVNVAALPRFCFSSSSQSALRGPFTRRMGGHSQTDGRPGRFPPPLSSFLPPPLYSHIHHWWHNRRGYIPSSLSPVAVVFRLRLSEDRVHCAPGDRVAGRRRRCSYLAGAAAQRSDLARFVRSEILC